jgi:hypothetical protein
MGYSCWMGRNNLSGWGTPRQLTGGEQNRPDIAIAPEHWRSGSRRLVVLRGW